MVERAEESSSGEGQESSNRAAFQRDQGCGSVYNTMRGLHSLAPCMLHFNMCTASMCIIDNEGNGSVLRGSLQLQCRSLANCCTPEKSAENCPEGGLCSGCPAMQNAVHHTWRHGVVHFSEFIPHLFLPLQLSP